MGVVNKKNMYPNQKNKPNLRFPDIPCTKQKPTLSQKNKKNIVKVDQITYTKYNQTNKSNEAPKDITTTTHLEEIII